MSELFEGMTADKLVAMFHDTEAKTRSALWRNAMGLSGVSPFRRMREEATAYEGIQQIIAEEIATLVAISNELGQRGYVYDLNEAVNMYTFFRTRSDDTKIGPPIFTEEDTQLLNDAGVTTLAQLQENTVVQLVRKLNLDIKRAVRIRKALALTGRKLAA